MELNQMKKVDIPIQTKNDRMERSLVRTVKLKTIETINTMMKNGET